MTPDLLADVRPPTPKKKAEEPREIRKPIREQWQEFHDMRTVDDSLEGCTARLDALDPIIDEIQEWIAAGAPRCRVFTRLSEKT